MFHCIKLAGREHANTFAHSEKPAATISVAYIDSHIYIQYTPVSIGLCLCDRPTCARRLLKRITNFSTYRTPKNPIPMMKSGSGYVIPFGARRASSRISRTCQLAPQNRNRVIFFYLERRSHALQVVN